MHTTAPANVSTPRSDPRCDAYAPHQIARRVAATGVTEAERTARSELVPGTLAGAFLATTAQGLP